MATVAANLQTALNNLVAGLAARSADWVAAGSPPTYSIDGQMVDWNGWYASQLKAIADLSGLVSSAAPFEIQTQAYT